MTRLASTYRWPQLEEWSASVQQIDDRSWGSTVRGALAASTVSDVTILRGHVPFGDGYSDLIAAGIIGRRKRKVLLVECTWEPGSRALDRALRLPQPLGYQAPARAARRSSMLALRRVDCPSVHYTVLSSDEARTFPDTWNVDPARVHITGFRATALDRGPVSAPALSSCAGVFSGGDNLRDYRDLIAAAPAINAPVTIATRLPLPPSGAPNLTAGPLHPQQYAEQASQAAVVVVALRAATVRSAGQQTYLNAMAQGKPVVVTDAPGVRDYVANGETGLVVPPGDPAALAAAVNRLLDDPSLARRLGESGRALVSDRYTPECYFSSVLDIARSIADS